MPKIFNLIYLKFKYPKQEISVSEIQYILHDTKKTVIVEIRFAHLHQTRRVHPIN